MERVQQFSTNFEKEVERFENHDEDEKVLSKSIIFYTFVVDL